MAAPLVDRSTGDVIPASDHNDVKDYIEDAGYRVNTLSLSIGGTEAISSARVFKPASLNVPSGGLTFYASDGVTIIATLDENGNLAIKGRVSSL